MNILILGSSGQIGKPLSSFLKAKQYRVIDWDITESQNHDLRVNNSLLEEQVKNCDCILFLAFNVGGSKYLKEFESKYEFLEDNLKIMLNTFEMIKKYNKKVIFTSSQMSSMVHSPYGNLKLIGERLTTALGGVNVRFWNVFGLEDADIKSHVITDFVNSALYKKQINMLTTGEEVRQFIHTDDVSIAMEKLILNYDILDKTKYFDITSFVWSSIKDIAYIINKHLPCKITQGNNHDSVQQSVKNEPTNEILKYWTPSITLEEGIKRIINSYLE